MREGEGVREGGVRGVERRSKLTPAVSDLSRLMAACVGGEGRGRRRRGGGRRIRGHALHCTPLPLPLLHKNLKNHLTIITDPTLSLSLTSSVSPCTLHSATSQGGGLGATPATADPPSVATIMSPA